MNKKTKTNKIILEIEDSKDLVTDLTPHSLIDCKAGQEIEALFSNFQQKYSKKVEHFQMKQELKEWKQEIKNITNKLKNQEKELKVFFVYNSTVEELERTKEELLKKTKELEELKAGFRKFYERTQAEKPHVTVSTTISKKTYSFECDLNKFEISSLYNKFFKKLFICDESDVINLLSENITTQITIKPGTKLVDVVAFFTALQSEGIIKSRLWANTIEKSQLIVFHGKPINRNQIKDAKKQSKNSPKNLYDNDLIKNTVKQQK